jgi:hexosaminidase
VSSSSRRWETSKIWPAPKAELYDTSNPVLRTLNVNSIDWVFDENRRKVSTEAQAIIETAQGRFIASLRKLVPPHPIVDPTDRDDLQMNIEIPGIQFQITSDDTKLEYGIDESYIIHIEHGINTTSSYIEIECVTVYGALHALQTLLQIVEFGWMESSENAPVFTISNTPLFVHDSPEYGYRGLLIDTSRHYLDVDLILTNLHVMAAHKLNVLHWHVVDSQSWPYVSSNFPELSEKAAFCRDCTYNIAQIKDVVQTAASLGIRVVVEMDLPGHSQGTNHTGCKLRHIHVCFLVIVPS